MEAQSIARLASFFLKRGFRCTRRCAAGFYFFFASTFLFCAFCSAQTSAENELGYPIKAAFLYKFCLYVEWPHTVFSSPDSPIMLGVAGPDVMVDELNAAVKDRTINNRKLEVHRIDQSSEVAAMNVLFVARSEETLLRDVIARSQNAPLLVVTEVEDGLDKGADINFIVKDNKVRFDVALDTSTRQGLHFSAQLLKVARNVRGENSR